jgi:hypothetical protein
VKIIITLIKIFLFSSLSILYFLSSYYFHIVIELSDADFFYGLFYFFLMCLYVSAPLCLMNYLIYSLLINLEVSMRIMVLLGAVIGCVESFIVMSFLNLPDRAVLNITVSCLTSGALTFLTFPFLENLFSKRHENSRVSGCLRG